MIDGTPPGIVERRHLIDRVFEKPPHVPAAQRLQTQPPLLHPRVERDASAALVRGQENQAAGRTVRKKKLTRQRVVSLDGSTISDGQSNMQNKVDTPAPGLGRGDIGGEEYRRRLEALRDEAGAGWLRVLSESGGLTENGGIKDTT